MHPRFWVNQYLKTKSRRLSISSGFRVFGLGVIFTADKSEVRQGLWPTGLELILHQAHDCRHHVEGAPGALGDQGARGG